MCTGPSNATHPWSQAGSVAIVSPRVAGAVGTIALDYCPSKTYCTVARSLSGAATKSAYRLGFE